MSTYSINLVSSDVKASTWKSQEPENITMDWAYSEVPLPNVDLHLIFGITGEIQFEVPPKRVIFVATEPPEIRTYDLQVLRKYSLVIGPQFRYFRGLENHTKCTGVLPRHIGIDHGDAPSQAGLRSFKELNEGQITKITTVTSNKSITNLQKARLELIDFLVPRIPGFVAFGRGIEPIADKADAIASARFHLAVENSFHSGYWTEKFADPVLMERFVFYGGHRAIKKEFNPHGFAMINPYDRRGTLRRIEKSLYSGLSVRNLTAMRENRETIEKKRNLFLSTENLVKGLQIPPVTQGLVTLDAHRPKKVLRTSQRS